MKFRLFSYFGDEPSFIIELKIYRKINIFNSYYNGPNVFHQKCVFKKKRRILQLSNTCLLIQMNYKNSCI